MRKPLHTIALLSVTVLALAGCAVEWENPKPAQRLAQEQQTPGSAYLGWRVYQDRCARCHGVEAQGTANAPNLLNRVQALGPREFVSLVLYRYDATLQGQPAATRSAREPQADLLMERQGQPLVMPAWQDEPRVNAHVLDLYAWLSQRAAGTLGPGKPRD